MLHQFVWKLFLLSVNLFVLFNVPHVPRAQVSLFYQSNCPDRGKQIFIKNVIDPFSSDQLINTPANSDVVRSIISRCLNTSESLQRFEKFLCSGEKPVAKSFRFPAFHAGLTQSDGTRGSMPVVCTSQ